MIATRSNANLAKQLSDHIAIIVKCTFSSTRFDAPQVEANQEFFDSPIPDGISLGKYCGSSVADLGSA